MVGVRPHWLSVWTTVQVAIGNCTTAWRSRWHEMVGTRWRWVAIAAGPREVEAGPSSAAVLPGVGNFGEVSKVGRARFCGARRQAIAGLEQGKETCRCTSGRVADTRPAPNGGHPNAFARH